MRQYRSRGALCSLKIFSEFFGSHHLGFSGRYQTLQEFVARHKEVALTSATEDENVIRMHQTIPQVPHLRKQSFGLREFHRRHSQIVHDALELRTDGIVAED